MNRTLFALTSIALTLSFATACDSESETPAPTSTSTSTPSTSASPTPTNTATSVATASPTAVVSPTRYRDATYEVGGKPVKLTNGLSEVEVAPGSASKITTRIFGNEAQADLNGDGLADVGFVLTQNTGGSGTFFYAVVALRTADGWRGTNAVLLGDRIAPQSTNIAGGKLVVAYADRKPGESMTAQPSVGVSKTLSIVNGRLTE